MLAHALLALLRDGADHGYRLKGRLDRRFGPVWKVNIGQVYQVLDRLRRERWVEELPPEAHRGGGHERWPVAITAAGRAELDRWLASAIRPTRPPGPARNEILGRLAVGGTACAREVLAGIAAERSVWEREYERITVLERERCERHGPLESAQRLALEASRLAIRAHLAWLDVCVEQVASDVRRERADATSRKGLRADGREAPRA